MLTDKKQIQNIFLLFSFTYFVSYITRINYGAVIAEMVTSTGLSKSDLSWALTGSFITYGTGQVLSGYFGDRIQPKKLVLIGLTITVIMNLLIPLCQYPIQMTITWCINGFAQTLMYPPMVKLMVSLLSHDDYSKGSVRISWGGSLGTMFIYLTAPVLIYILNWQSVFFLCAAIGAFGIFLWQKNCPTIKTAPAASPKESKKAAFFSPLIICLMIAIALQGILRDGITTWMPSFISETYNLTNEISILTGIILPVFSIICLQIAAALYRKLRNPIICSCAIFSVSTIAALLLFVLYNKNAACSVFLSAILTGCMHGANYALICMIPPFFIKRGNVSFVSGTLNACTYIGSAASAYLFPLISENSGWSSTILLWVFVALAGSLISALCARPWKNFIKKL